MSTQAFSHIFWRLIALQGLASSTYGVPTVRDSTTGRHGTTLVKRELRKILYCNLLPWIWPPAATFKEPSFLLSRNKQGHIYKKENAWRKQLETIRNTAPDLHPQLKESAFSLSPLATDTRTPPPPPAPTVDAQHRSRTLLLLKSRGSREKSSTTHEKMGSTKQWHQTNRFVFVWKLHLLLWTSPAAPRGRQGAHYLRQKTATILTIPKSGRKANTRRRRHAHWHGGSKSKTTNVRSTSGAATKEQTPHTTHTARDADGARERDEAYGWISSTRMRLMIHRGIMNHPYPKDTPFLHPYTHVCNKLIHTMNVTDDQPL